MLTPEQAEALKKDRKALNKERRRLKSSLEGFEKSLQELKDAGAPQAAIDLLQKSVDEVQADYALIAPKKGKGKKNKYNAKKVNYKNESYDSKREAYFAQLLDSAGVQYSRQVNFQLIPDFEIESGKVNGTKLRLDYVIPIDENKAYAVDIKGFKTPLAKMKLKLLQFQNLDNFEYHFPTTNDEVEKLADAVAGHFGLKVGTHEVEELKMPEKQEEGDAEKPEPSPASKPKNKKSKGK